mmetsp:Transcript_30459/g.63707  ORF Transcript_30459/g.63707 Transcript_30459/m.63707 type:complete len:213 (+) Transcript_30459:124-762(+)
MIGRPCSLWWLLLTKHRALIILVLVRRRRSMSMHSIVHTTRAHSWSVVHSSRADPVRVHTLRVHALRGKATRGRSKTRRGSMICLILPLALLLLVGTHLLTTSVVLIGTTAAQVIHNPWMSRLQGICHHVPPIIGHNVIAHSLVVVTVRGRWYTRRHADGPAIIAIPTTIISNGVVTTHPRGIHLALHCHHRTPSIRIVTRSGLTDDRRTPQ